MRAWPKPATTCFASTSTRTRSNGSSGRDSDLRARPRGARQERPSRRGASNSRPTSAAGVAHGLFQFIAVGTPPDEDGSADLSHVLAVARSIGEHLREYRIIVDKSTVPVGTADLRQAEIQDVLERAARAIEFDVVSNPEFLKEGAAIEDFMKPDRIIVGTDNPRTAELLRALYEPFNRNHDRMIVMDVRSAELTKYAANAMLATKISFMNELANVAERVGADIEHVRIGIGSDPRIGYDFIYPGCGYGGSCFPKDVQALAASARRVGLRQRAPQGRRERQRPAEARAVREGSAATSAATCAARSSRCGGSRSSRTPTTCARRRAGRSWRRSGRRAHAFAPTTRWRGARRARSTASAAT